MASFVIDTKGIAEFKTELSDNEEEISGNEVEESDLEEEKPSLELLQGL